MSPEDVKSLIFQIESSKALDGVLLDSFIDSVANHRIELPLIKQWLMAVHSNGISVNDTTRLTKGMMLSGEVINWQDNKLVVDKHSTGGVGDKMSLMLAPILAACGLKVPMLAGRGLGHTGGTIDKLESIPGFNCSLNPVDMKAQVEKIGCCIAAQNDAIAPADGLLYAIRDVTDTIDSVPLITASIVSKKAAEGLGSLVLDVKCGSAAFMQNMADAEQLATSMVNAARGLGINTIAQITQMDYPIGKYIGNSLEVLGSIEVLQGHGSSDTLDIVILQCKELLVMTEKVSSHDEAELLIREVIVNGSALRKFKQMCISQGVDENTAQLLISHPHEVLLPSKFQTPIKANSSGYLTDINAMALAEIARNNGAGRFAMTDSIIPEVGFEIIPNKGDYLSVDDVWLVFHHNEEISDATYNRLVDSLVVSDEPVISSSRLIRVIEG